MGRELDESNYGDTVVRLIRMVNTLPITKETNEPGINFMKGFHKYPSNYRELGKFIKNTFCPRKSLLK